MTTSPTNSSPLDEAASTASATTTESTGQTETGPKRVFPSRKLSDDQEREVTRLYAETTTPQAEIARRFGIGQTSVPRIAQRHGAPLRTPGLTRASANGTPVPSEAAPAPSRPAEAEMRPTEPAATARPAPVGGPRPDEAPTRRQRSPAVKHAGAARVAPRAGSAARLSLRPATGPANGTRRRFRITFVAEQVIKARSILDALRQAEARGATDVTSITRAD